MKNNIGIIIFPFILFLSFSTIAAPPDFVYRVDSRGYNEIFANGFQAWGNDYNIVAHINGATCSIQEGSTSGFISTSANRATALALVNEHTREGRTAYLYTIRADETFYSGPASIDNIQRHNPLSPLSIMSLEMARRANEWDAVDIIPPENIREVEVYNPNGTDNSYTNPRYLSVDTTGNPNPYTGHFEDVLEYYNFPIQLPDGLGSRLSACFSLCFGSSSGNRIFNNGESCNENPEGVINFKSVILNSIKKSLE